MQPLAESVDSLETVLAGIDRALRPGGQSIRDTAASRLAAKNRQANLDALRLHQPDEASALQNVNPPPLEWVFGRDGYLTGRDAAGKWWSGTSIPLCVGRSLLKNLDATATVACFLSPNTAGQIRAALEKLQPHQAILAAIPDPRTAAVILSCDDFSAEFRAARLFIAAGSSWAIALSRILTDHAGLPVPLQFIKTPLTSDDALTEMMAAANPAFSAEIQRRAEQAAQIRDRFRQKNWQGKPPCVIVSSHYRTWDFASLVLSRLTQSMPDWKQLDTDRPTSASPLALAMAAEDSGAIVAADLFRADVGNVIPDAMPWITWVTRGRIARFTPNTADRLLLADRAWIARASESAWPADRISIAGWPELSPPTPPRSRQIAFIADAALIDLPDKLREFSSHGLLWESIAAELLEHPHALANDPDAYLTDRAAKLGIPPETLDRPLFIDKLILPSWRRGAANALKCAGLNLTFFGNGWPTPGATIASFDQLLEIAQNSAALICPVPTLESHPIDAFNRPVIRALKPAATRPVTLPRLSTDQLAALIQ
ncbi:MAG TPA: hypothetical protein VMD30_06325 [Tepidisphaeraceae bacterium]|nr:hypothetical protein [Tepidisphaeraceae bacterium]